MPLSTKEGYLMSHIIPEHGSYIAEVICILLPHKPGNDNPIINTLFLWYNHGDCPTETILGILISAFEASIGTILTHVTTPSPSVVYPLS
jgi:hypothetical protein